MTSIVIAGLDPAIHGTNKIGGNHGLPDQVRQ
jgi:hypothetical protein